MGFFVILTVSLNIINSVYLYCNHCTDFNNKLLPAIVAHQITLWAHGSIVGFLINRKAIKIWITYSGHCNPYCGGRGMYPCIPYFVLQQHAWGYPSNVFSAGRIPQPVPRGVVIWSVQNPSPWWSQQRSEYCTFIFKVSRSTLLLTVDSKKKWTKSQQDQLTREWFMLYMGNVPSCKRHSCFIRRAHIILHKL